MSRPQPASARRPERPRRRDRRPRSRGTGRAGRAAGGQRDRPRSHFPIPRGRAVRRAPRRRELFTCTRPRADTGPASTASLGMSSKVRSYPAATRASCTVGSNRPPVRLRASSASSTTSRSSGLGSIDPLSFRRESSELGSKRVIALEASELTLDRYEGPDRLRVRLGVEEGLDVRPHRPEPVSFHHDVWVLVTGGVETTATDGGAGADQDEFDGAAVAAAAVAAACALAARSLRSGACASSARRGRRASGASQHAGRGCSRDAPVPPGSAARRGDDPAASGTVQPTAGR